MIDRKKEKLIHAMIFFIKETKYCYKLKLFKLLYFLDFNHFKQTGKTVTGLEYFAWPMGPVPSSLYEEINNPINIKKFFKIIPEKKFSPDFPKDKALKFIPKIEFDKFLFSKREIEIMDQLVELYKNIKSKDMSQISHKTGGPWDRVFNKDKNKQGFIPYEYILDNSPNSISKEEAKEIAQEDDEMKKMFG